MSKTRAELLRSPRHPDDRYEESVWTGRRIVNWRGRFPCPHCGRVFRTARGRGTHTARYCRDNPDGS